MLTRWMAVLLVAGFIFSCKKETDPQFLPEPHIAFISQSQDTIREFSDSLVITIEYTDGDGDLGVNESEEKNVFLKDIRNGLVYEYRLRQVAPSGSSIAVKGLFDLVVEDIPLLGPSPESFLYTIKVSDRAGNISNTITTNVVTVTE